MEKIILQLFLLITFSTSANHFSSPELKDYSEAVMGTTTSVANGNWTNSGIWSNGVPNANTRAIIGNNTTVNIVGNHNAQEVVVHGVLQVTENNTNKSLRTRWIHVNSGGIFRIGTATNRYDQSDFTLTLTGTNPLADHVIPLANGNNINVNNNDGFLMAAGGGRLQFFGEERLSFTKLETTAEAGSNSIIVHNVIERNFDGSTSIASDGRLNWEIGDEIVIASSRFRYTDEDVHTITGIQNYGTRTRLTLNRPTTHRHYGEIEIYGSNLRPGSRPATGRPTSVDLRAEVALLSRNIVVKGLDAQDTDNSFGDRARLQVHSSGSQAGKPINGIGGHIMIMNTAGQTTVDGIQMDQMGQAGRLGRYPIHWHFGGNKRGDVVRNSSITNSNNRAVVVHGTDNVLIQGVVAHDVHGHGFFLESGVERGNRFEANIALGIHRTGGNRNLTDPMIVDDADRFQDSSLRFRSTAAFWITGATNDFVGNIAAGAGGTAFWIAQPDVPVSTPVGTAFEPWLTSDPYLGEMYQRDPDLEEMGIFDSNTGHSMVTGLIVIPGGHSSFIANNAGQFRENVDYFNNVDPVFSNTTFYKTSTALYPLVTNVTLQLPDFRSVDNEIALMDSDPMRIDGGLIVGDSRSNSQRRQGFRRANDGHRLVQIYHGYSVFEDVHIAGFANGSLFSTDIGDRHRPDINFEGISWEDDGSHSQLLEGVGANRQYTQKTIYDRDGSLTSGIGGGAGWSIVTSFNNWIIDTNDGDKVFNTNGSYTGLTQKRVANMQLYPRHQTPYENARWRMTNRQGQVYEIGGNADERDTQILINRRPRLQLVLGEEYEVEFPRGVDLNTEGVRFNLLQYSIPDGSQSVTLRFKGMANQMRPTFFETGEDVPRNSQLRFLRSATRTTYFPDPSTGDLYVKIFNRGVGVQSGYINMVPINNQAPTVSFARPTNGAQLTEGDDLNVLANASDSDDRVAFVQLFFNNTLVRTDTRAPYEWGQNFAILNNLSAGTHTLRLLASDNFGTIKQTSITINVASANPNQAPSVSFARPSNGAQLTEGDNLYVLANAADSDGSIARVQLFFNNTLVRTEGQAPYEWGADNQNDPLLNNLSAGTHTLRLVATDNDGATRQSSITINVSSPSTGICDFTPINGKALDIGSGLGKMFVVGTNRRIYERRDNNWVILPDGGFQADRVDVGGGGQAMVVATDGKIYRFSPNNRWVLVSGSATDVGANRNALYVIGNGGIVYKRNSNPFNWIRINPSVRAKKLDVYVDGNAWIIGTDGFVYQLINNNWFRKGTFKARDIGISEGSDKIWALSESDGSLYFYEGRQVWSKQSDQTGNHISVRDDNRIWVVDGQGNILFSDCEANNGVQQRIFPDRVASINISIAPNPAQNYINIDLSELMNQNVHYIISSLNGKLVLEGNFDNDHNELETINLEGFSNGIYVIYTKQGQGKKFIIMKN